MPNCHDCVVTENSSQCRQRKAATKHCFKWADRNPEKTRPLGSSGTPCSTAKRVYSHEQIDEINKKLPRSIVDALNQVGWNALGVYELCEEVLTVVP